MLFFASSKDSTISGYFNVHGKQFLLLQLTTTFRRLKYLLVFLFLVSRIIKGRK